MIAKLAIWIGFLTAILLSKFLRHTIITMCIYLCLWYLNHFFLVPCWAQDNGTTPAEPATDTPTREGEEPFTTTDATPETTSPSVEETIADPLCYKLTQVLANITSDRGDAVCMLNSACNGLVCNFTAFSMKLWILPCAHPPVVRMALIDGQGKKLFDDVVKETARVQGQSYSVAVEYYDRQEGEFGLEVTIKNIRPLAYLSKLLASS